MNDLSMVPKEGFTASFAAPAPQMVLVGATTPREG